MSFAIQNNTTNNSNFPTFGNISTPSFTTQNSNNQGFGNVPSFGQNTSNATTNNVPRAFEQSIQLNTFRNVSNETFEGFKIGIYMREKSKICVCNKELFVMKNTENPSLLISYLNRDMNFSLLARRKEIFSIGVFLYNPSEISYSSILKSMNNSIFIPPNTSSFKHLGEFFIEFNIDNNGFNHYTENYFYGKAIDTTGNNLISFQFTYNLLNRQEDLSLYRQRNIQNMLLDPLYLIAIPQITVDLKNLVV